MGWAIAAVILEVSKVRADPVEILSALAIFVASGFLATFWSTTEVHATWDRIWLKRFGFTQWSIAMDSINMVEGAGDNWRFIYVFDRETGKRVGRFNWWVVSGSFHNLLELVDEAQKGHRG
jgi:hypothetical protein